MNKTKKECGIYFRKEGEIIIHSWSRDLAGVGFISKPFFKCNLRDNIVTIGQYVLDALLAKNDSLPTNPSEILMPLFDLTNTKSWKGFMSKSKYLEVYHFDNTLYLNPMNDMGGKIGFIPKDNKYSVEFILDKNTPREMGELIVSSIKLF